MKKKNEVAEYELRELAKEQRVSPEELRKMNNLIKNFQERNEVSKNQSLDK